MKSIPHAQAPRLVNLIYRWSLRQRCGWWLFWPRRPWRLIRSKAVTFTLCASVTWLSLPRQIKLRTGGTGRRCRASHYGLTPSLFVTHLRLFTHTYPPHVHHAPHPLQPCTQGNSVRNPPTSILPTPNEPRHVARIFLLAGTCLSHL